MAKEHAGTANRSSSELKIDFKQISDKALDNVTDLIFISDPISKEILFVNKAFSEATGIHSPHGLTCYNSLRKRQTPCSNCHNIQAFENGFQITHNNLAILDKCFSIKSCKIYVGEKSYNLNIATEKQDYQHKQVGSALKLGQRDAVLAEIYELFCKNCDEPNLQLFNVLCLLGKITAAQTVSIYEPKKVALHTSSAYLRSVFYAQNEKQDISDPPEDDLPKELINTAFSVAEPSLYNKENLSEAPALADFFTPEIKAVMVYPLLHDHQHIGILVLKNPELKELKYNADYLHILEVFVTQTLFSKQQSSELYHLQNFDHLTKLYNRNVLMQDLLEYDQQEGVGVVLVNINGLKHINHFEGLAEGDKAIVQTGELIRQIVREKGVIYRVSGDEFIVVFCEMDRAEFTQQANALSMLLSQESSFSAAVGFAYTEVSGQISALIQLAQSEMFNHKREFYRRHPVNERYRNDKDHILSMLSVEKISELIANHSFSLRYQPKYSLQRYKVSGAEALIRFELAGEVVAASEFIPSLDAAHLTYLIDYFVIETVCAKIRERIDQGLKIVPISCNLSRHTIVRQDFLPKLKEIFERYQIPYNLIPLEISERSNSLYHKELIDACIALATHGFILTIDDFGVAQANIWALADLPVSEIKFDKKLIDSLDRPNNFKIITILNVMITLCNKMHIKTIAEGVDKKAQSDILEKIGCNEIQGFYFSRPIPESAFYRLL